MSRRENTLEILVYSPFNNLT